MIRPGSLTAISVQMSEAAAGSNAIFGVYKNGTIIDAAAIATLASATSMTKGGSIFAAGAYKFAAGDVLDVRIRTGSGWTAATADANVIVEVEVTT
jgi:hypothetical protein